ALQLDIDGDVERLLDVVGDAKLVLIGEASHGTHEFYRVRADITRALISTPAFNLVAVEADWPDAYRANRWVRLVGSDASAHEALSDFMRFPRWMWRNWVVVDFLRGVRDWTAGRPERARTGFYGLDLYSLHRSIDCVLQYLQKVDPEAAHRARRRY